MNVKRHEVIKLIGICSANYRNWPCQEDETDRFNMVVTLWMDLLEDIEYSIAEAAVKKFLAESTFPPTIADIRKRIGDITVRKEKTAIEAWDDVKTAIRIYGWYNEKAAMERLTGSTRKVVESLGFKTLCVSENEMADRAHFLKVYDTLTSREREDALMLNSTRAAIEQLHGPNDDDVGTLRRLN